MMTMSMPAVLRIMLGALMLSQFLIGMLLTHQTMFEVLGWMGVPNTDNTFSGITFTTSVAYLLVGFEIEMDNCMNYLIVDSVNYFYFLFPSQLPVAAIVVGSSFHFLLVQHLV